MKQEDIEKAMAIVNVFETGKPHGNYATLAVLNDGAGISYGIKQFTHRSGSLLQVIEKYLATDATAGRETIESRTRLNLFFPDRIEKYVADDRHAQFLPDAKSFTVQSARFIAYQGETKESVRDESRTLNNPYGVVPVFHFANNADIGAFGRSELDDAMAVQDGLNKSVLDMLVAMEVCSFRQRWAAGIEVLTDETTGKDIPPFKVGMDNVWMTENIDARFGEFGASDLEQFLKVKDGFRIDMASVTGTPLYYLMPQIRGFPSGESLRKAETRFLAKVRDRQEQFGAVWEDVMSFALRLAGHPDVSLTARWEDASPMNERDVLENLRIKLDLGVPPEQIIREAGY